MKDTTASSRTELRRLMRSLRHELTAPQRRRAAEQAARHLARSHLFRRSKRIAGYFANDNELDPHPLMERAWAMGKDYYVPIIRRDGHLWFAPYRRGQRLVPNTFGIPEPLTPPYRLRHPRALDLIITPLVAFDAHGNRLGMGGGFYDRTLSFLRHRQRWIKPYIIGAAYECQQVASLQNADWDVPMQGIVTETGLRLFSGAIATAPHTPAT